MLDFFCNQQRLAWLIETFKVHTLQAKSYLAAFCPLAQINLKTIQTSLKTALFVLD